MYGDIMIIALCSLLLLLLLWKEIKRLNKSWLTARIVATVMAVISLACLALPVTFKKQRATNNVTAVLLTEGFNADSVRKILRANTGTKVFAINKNITSLHATYIPDVSFFDDPSLNFNEVHVFGYGLDRSDLSLVKNTHVIFHPATINNKISSVGWTQDLVSGEKLFVQGSFNNTSSAQVKVVLTGFDTNLDSVMLAAKQTSDFQLTAVPKHVDKAVYSISVLSGKDTLEKEPVPVEVKMIEPLSILLLASSPDFENRFLRNWLAQNEYKFAVRTYISKSKYDKQFANMPAVPLDRITSSLLEKFDVVIADASALAVLPAPDNAAIRGYVESKGMGLIVKEDNAERSSAFYSASFPLIETRDSVQHRIKLNLGDTSQVTNYLKIEQPVYIRAVAGTQPLVKDLQMRIVSNSKMYGLGKVILTTIPNTYTWQLSGNSSDYTSYWSLLFKKAAKKIPLQEIWNIKPGLPIRNETVHLKLQSAKTNIPQVQTGSNIVYLSQNPALLYEWAATYWPLKAGWQLLMSGANVNTWWYVYDDKDWNGVKAAAKIMAAKKYINGQKRATAKASIINAEETTAVPKIYFFVIFVIFSGFLWFEKKYRNG